jgi:hypothetical protein
VTRLETRRSPCLRAGEYFIREEQRHARYLRDFLALEGFGLPSGGGPTPTAVWKDAHGFPARCSSAGAFLDDFVALP